MKTQSLIWMVALSLAIPLALRAQAPGLRSPYVINLTEALAIQVLDLYRHASGLELVIASRVDRLSAKISIEARPVDESETVKLLEKALLEQAGIVITKLDDKRASVTYNDALSVKAVPSAKPKPPPAGPDGKPIQPPKLSTQTTDDIRARVASARARAKISGRIDPDHSIYDIPLGTTEDQFIAAHGKPAGYLRLNNDDTVMIYGQSHAFIFEAGRLAGVRITSHLIDWKLSNDRIDASPFDRIEWGLSNGIESTMTLKQVKQILGEKLLGERWRHRFSTEKALVELDYSHHTQEGEGDEAYMLYGILVRAK